MNNKAHLRPQDYDSNGDIIPMSMKEEKGDLISREALKKELNSRVFQGDYTTTLLLSSFNDLIDNAPTVDTYTIEDIQTVREDALILGAKLAQRPQGEWIKIGDIGLAYTCNKCGEVNVIPTNFCPNCGAKMKGGAE